jgi:hypothetical protein
MRDSDRKAEPFFAVWERNELPEDWVASRALRPPTSSPNSCANSGALAVQPDQRSRATVVAWVQTGASAAPARASCPAIHAARLFYREIGNQVRRNSFVFYPPVSRYAADVAPPTGSRSFVIRADMTLGHHRSGCIVARGSANGGYVLIRDRTCRLFGYHGLADQDGRFSLDHMFGF